MRHRSAFHAVLSGLLTLALVLSLGCKGNDNNGNPGLYPFQLPINTGQDPSRLDPVLTSIRLEPGGGINLQVGTGIDVKAIGTFSDGLVAEVTGLAIFEQSNAGVGSLSLDGRFVAQNPGQTRVSAKINNIFSDPLFITAKNLITSEPSAVQGLSGAILPGDNFRLTWLPNPSEEAVIGYVIYRSRTSAQFTFKTAEGDPTPPEMIVTTPLTGNVYTDESAVGGVVYYVVQAIRRDANDPDVLVFGAASRQLKVNFATDTVGEED